MRPTGSPEERERRDAAEPRTSGRPTEKGLLDEVLGILPVAGALGGGSSWAQAASPLIEKDDSRLVARASVAAVTIEPITTAVASDKRAFRSGLRAIALAMPSEY